MENSFKEFFKTCIRSVDSMYYLSKVSREAVYKRYKQGWVVEVCDNLDELITLIRKHRQEKTAASIAYHGNIVDVWYDYNTV